MAAGDLVGRSFFVTGASSGIGRSMAEALRSPGASVVLAARSEERTRPVLEGIRRQYPSSDVQSLQIDLANLDSVRRAAGEYLGSGKPIDVLVNNAGIAGTNGLSPQGFDLTYATNHIGPFLLTNMLLPRIREASQGRDRQRGQLGSLLSEADGLEYARPPDDASAEWIPDYALTKLMNVLHAKSWRGG